MVNKTDYREVKRAEMTYTLDCSVGLASDRS